LVSPAPDWNTNLSKKEGGKEGKIEIWGKIRSQGTESTLVQEDIMKKLFNKRGRRGIITATKEKKKQDSTTETKTGGRLRGKPSGHVTCERTLVEILKEGDKKRK